MDGTAFVTTSGTLLSTGRSETASGGTTPLDGMRAVGLNEPVCHVSFYEADAFARWAGARLATEFEWEVAAVPVAVERQFAGDDALHPKRQPTPRGWHRCSAMCGSGRRAPISRIPDFRPAAGAVGEYNGKFMCNQMVLRGGSCATPQSHIRRHLPQFLSSPCALAVHGHPVSRMATSKQLQFIASDAVALAVREGLTATPEAPSLRGCFYDEMGSAAVRADHGAARSTT